MNKDKIELPEHIIEILNIFKKNGYKAFIVGGCVRDILVGKKPEDWDISTSAKPNEVKELFNKTYDTGIKHGTVTLIFNAQKYEVTTFRKEGKYINSRRPKNVYYTDDLHIDLARRDFTVNAIAVDIEGNILDIFNGVSDISDKIIRCVGNPDERFSEDALRLLRAIRFSCQLDFTIETSTFRALKKNSKLISNISFERIRDEFNLILLSNNIQKGIYLLRESNILNYIMPELDKCFSTEQNHPYHLYNVGDHILKSVSNIDKSIVLRWAMLLHDVGKPLCKTTDKKGISHFYGHSEKSVTLANNILTRFKLDNKSKDKIITLIKYHDKKVFPTPKSVKKNLRLLGRGVFWDLVKVREADIKAQNPIYLKEREKLLNDVISIYNKIIKDNECFTIKDLNINGNDLIKAGFKEGKNIGDILNRLLNLVIENPELNKKELLLEKANRYGKKNKQHNLNGYV